MNVLIDRHALVTGGGSGIGAAVARTLSSQGAKVTLVGRREEALRQVADSLEHATVAPADITERSQVDAAFEIARRAHGPIDILVNNAGIAPSAPFGETPFEEWRRVMAVNCDALFHCCQAALPDLLAADNGRIVTVASTAGLKGYAYTAAYVASKHAAVGLTRALAAEFARTNLTANAVCPGFTDTDIVSAATDMIADQTGRGQSKARAALTRFNPQNRLVQPEEVARAVLYLCDPGSAAVNGVALPVAGGEV